MIECHCSKYHEPVPHQELTDAQAAHYLLLALFDRLDGYEAMAKNGFESMAKNPMLGMLLPKVK